MAFFVLLFEPRCYYGGEVLSDTSSQTGYCFQLLLNRGQI